MNDTFEQAAQLLDTQLSASGEDYRLLEQLSPTRCRMAFTGLFNGRPVVWDVTLRTLQDYAAELKGHRETAQISCRQFIDIESGQDCYRAQVALKLDRIDAAAIGRTIIMIRQYKRLQPGRHEYGEPVIF